MVKYFILCLLYTDQISLNHTDSFVKDVWSVSLYPYNRSQILQYVKYTK